MTEWRLSHFPLLRWKARRVATLHSRLVLTIWLFLLLPWFYLFIKIYLSICAMYCHSWNTTLKMLVSAKSKTEGNDSAARGAIFSKHQRQMAYITGTHLSLAWWWSLTKSNLYINILCNKQKRTCSLFFGECARPMILCASPSAWPRLTSF